jgi:hypothetical protein
MSRNPPSAVADFFAAFEVAHRSMQCPATPSRVVPEAAGAVDATAPKRPAATRAKRKHGLGGTGVDLGDVMAGWPPLQPRTSR